jgi:hypothetical protein
MISKSQRERAVFGKIGCYAGGNLSPVTYALLICPRRLRVDALGRLECPLFLCGGCAISAISPLIPEAAAFGAPGGGPNGGGASAAVPGLAVVVDKVQGT